MILPGRSRNEWAAGIVFLIYVDMVCVPLLNWVFTGFHIVHLYDSDTIMAAKNSLVSVFWTGMTILHLAVVCLLVYLWVGWELKTRKAEFNQVRQTFITAQKETIKTQVQQAVHYIEHKKSLAEKRVRQTVKSRTLEAWETADHIWRTNRDIHPKEKIQQLIHDALFPASWDQGKGYYFAEDMAGTELINRNNPELEGVNLMDLQDSKGKYILRDFIRIARTPEREGFSIYHWNKPDTPGVLVPKISYIKYFPPMDWVIGNGKYIVEEEEKIKSEVLAYLDQFTFGENGYIFAATFDGLSLTGPFKGKNTYDIQDANGTKIVQELIAAARAGGGFVRYVAPKYKGHKPAPKLSYAQAIDDWGWYIGTGVYVDSIETLIREKQAKLNAATDTLIAKTVLGLVASLLISVCLAWLLSGRIRQNLVLFIDFFRQSATDHQPMADRQITFSEFAPLARSANRMLQERNAYEAALIKSEKKYRRLFEQSKDAFLIMENYRFTDCNQAAVDMLGYEDKSDIVNASPTELSPPDQSDGRDSLKKAKEMVQKAHRKGSHRFEWDHIRADGGVFPVEVLLTPISTERERQIFHTTWRDISGRKKAEALMIQTEKMITVGGLAAGMAHEINNPLAGMIQSAQVAKHRMSPELAANREAAQNAGMTMDALARYDEQRNISKFLDTIVETGGRAASIVRNMLNFVRRKSGEKTSQDIRQIMDLALELAVNDYSLTTTYDIRQITIKRHYPAELPMILCDESNIQQVFFNIIKNAAQAMAGHTYPEETAPRIGLHIKGEAGRVNVTIEDNGPGMDPSVAKRIFEPFYTTKPVNQGTGLGLSVSYFIVVEDHGGSLEVSSRPGQGTSFFVSLPVTAETGDTGD